MLPVLVERGFLDARGSAGYMFHHALAQEVTYGRILRRRRRDLHRLVAETGERIYGAGDETIGLLAHHYYLAHEGERALPYLIAAADGARRLSANDEAILHLSRAVSSTAGLR